MPLPPLSADPLRPHATAPPGRVWLVPLVSLAWLGAAAARPSPSAIDFRRDVLPILSANCFACHGPDARPGRPTCGSTSPPVPSAATTAVIVPGRSAESELYLRIASWRRR